MKTIAGTSHVYHKRYLNQKLPDHCKGQLYFGEVNRKNDVACFHDSMSSIINDKCYDNSKENDEEEAEKMVKAAAKSIFRDIRSTKLDKYYYPETCPAEDVNANIEWLRTYFRLFLQHLLRKPIHQASIDKVLCMLANLDLV